MINKNEISGYRFDNPGLSHAHGFLLPTLFELLDSLNLKPKDRRVFELGCGNGSVADQLTRRGFDVTGVDPSEEGLALAEKAYPHLKICRGSAYDDLPGRFGSFPVVVSLEVVEHLYSPQRYASTVYDLLEDGGVAIISTPYHGYLKNLAMALIGKMDKHFTALWEQGHIKFWSIVTLRQLLKEAGFVDIRFHRVGRIPPLAKAMIAVAKKGWA
jgi:cyclopropane fatty-acyl-phospholipid synthase-like methyltransferase